MNGSRKTKTEKEKRKKDRTINKEIKKDRKEKEKEISFLLLGTGESGKSTFVKQMQILYYDGFDEETQNHYRNAIRSQLRANTGLLIEVVDTLEIKLKKKTKLNVEKFIRLNEFQNEDMFITEELADCIESVWKDKSIKKAFDERYDFQIPDSASWFFDKTSEIASENYIPTDQDILSCRIPTTGINQIQFKVKEHNWNIIDVGGQRNERKKWLHQFEECTILLYLVAMNEYNQTLYEKEGINRLHESLNLFKKISNMVFFRHTNCVILFNKMDLFEEKIKKYDLKKCFDDYHDGNDLDCAKEFIKNKFYQVAKNKNRQIFIHFMCAIQTENIKVIIRAVQTSIITKLTNTELL
ncbi:g protein alpha i subunit [Anaeramoeba flamelloides]|uniref:G protein alpha i subunit n=1 Tax=Anaeramoeba flamelloides TaxID=1746091 RepID=A0ABQ8XNQ8_9EUKA|nr:g protein alpha i subunit [Anaeramoeba flamelloides]